MIGGPGDKSVSVKMACSLLAGKMPLIKYGRKSCHWLCGYGLLWTESSALVPRMRGLHCQQSMHCRHGSPGDVRDGGPWRVLFFGTDHFSLPHLKVLHSSQSQKPGHAVQRLEVVIPESKFIKRRGKRKVLSPVLEYCKAHELCHHRWPLAVKPSGFDLGIIVSFGHLLPDWLIESFPLGVLNVHPSLLPRWRGGAPIQHTIMNGDATTGVSIMRIQPDRFDVGPLLLQKEFGVSERSTTESLSEALSEEGSKMILEVLSDLTGFIAKETAQSEEGVTYGRKIPASLSWVDWHSSVREVDRLYRAIGEQMPLRTVFREEELKLEQMVAPEGCSDMAAKDSDLPGLVTFNKQKNIVCIRCSDGWVGFGSVSPAGRKRMTAQEFYNGYLSGARGAGALHFRNPHVWDG